MTLIPPELFGVPMIPFGLLSAFVNKKEVRITEFSETGFRFRTAKPCSAPVNIRLAFWQMKLSSYQEVSLSVTSFSFEQRYDYFYEYTVLTKDPVYRSAVNALLGWYGSYVNRQLTEDDSELSMALTGYPAEQENIHFETFAAQKQAWFQEPDNLPDFSFLNTDTPELAIELDRPELYTSYLNMNFSDWLSQYWASNQLSWHPLSRLQLTRLYIGNQFCHLLFPEEDLLFTLMDKTWADGLAVTLSFSYLREFMLKPIQQLLEILNFWCQKHQTTVEIVVNDWAMAEMLKGKSLLVPALGILLNKRRKDPRLHYKTGTMEQIGADADKYLSENNLNADFYREYLKKEYGIVRYEWESCGYDMTLPPGKNSLHLPFYQTNTSQYCTLYAKCMTGERGKQKLAEECPKFCKDYAFLYPDHLIMIGRYNSLFALDSRIFEDGSGSGTGTEIGTKIKTEKILKEWKKAGVDRLVVNLLDSGVKR